MSRVVPASCGRLRPAAASVPSIRLMFCGIVNISLYESFGGRLKVYNGIRLPMTFDIFYCVSVVLKLTTFYAEELLA